MTPRQQQAVALHKAIEIRKVHLRAAIARSSWRNVGILRLQIAQLSSRRMGIARAGAAAGDRPRRFHSTGLSLNQRLTTHPGKSGGLKRRMPHTRPSIGGIPAIGP